MTGPRTVVGSIRDPQPRRRTRRRASLAALPTMAALLAACSRVVEYYPPDAELRGRLGTVAVVSTASQPEVEARPPAPITDAGEGAGIAAGSAAKAAAVGGWVLTGACMKESVRSEYGVIVALLGCPIFGVVGTVLAVPAALGGAAYGAASSSSEEEAKAADDALSAFASGIRPDEALVAKLVAAVRERTDLPVRDVEGSEWPATGPSGRPYRAYAAAGIDTVVELGAVRVALLGSGRFRPLLRYEIEFDARLVRSGDGAALYDRRWKYISPAMGYFDATAAEVKLLRESIDAALDRMAAKAVGDLFVSGETERRGLTARPVETVFTTYASNSQIKGSAHADPAPEAAPAPSATPAAPDAGRNCDYPGGPSYVENCRD